ncbi:MAG: hypothetical protein WCF81_05560 [Roseiarcus sp.]
MNAVEDALARDANGLNACVARVRAAGGLMTIDPLREMERVNKIPWVQDASKQYGDCAVGRAEEMARTSKEAAETIARAALGVCSLSRQQYLVALARALDVPLTPQIAAQEEKETIGALIGRIIAARAAAAGRSGEDAERK